MLTLTALTTLGGLTMALASMLVLANRVLYVAEDPRIERVDDMLPHTNCGACGFPGCRAFAEGLVAGEASPGQCTVGAPADHARIAAFLGVDVGARERRVARLACAGGDNVAVDRARYDGLQSCRGAALVAGGGKGCFWGCLLLGDCAEACEFDAIRMDAHGLPVVDEARCTACGDCVEVCPKDLFSLQPVGQRLWVACSSLEAGDELLEDCQVACTACARCAQDAPGQVVMKDNLPLVDPTRRAADDTAIRRCPTGSIVWLDAAGVPRKGAAAHPIIRQGPRAAAPT